MTPGPSWTSTITYVEGPRVVGASVVPNIARANTNLTWIMIGEHVAD